MMLRPYRADLHIHTVLSPCTDMAEMTPRGIVERALSIGLDMIAICDHNSCENTWAVQKAARGLPIKVLAGIEVTSSEEVHTLGLFNTSEESIKLQEVVYSHLPGENDPEVFGYQLIMDENDDIIGINDHLLIGATTLSIREIVDWIHKFGGIAIGSHCDRDSYGLISNLGFIPEDLAIDALEISPRITFERAMREIPQLRGYPIVHSSDAHYLKDIGKVFTVFWIEDGNISEILKALRNIGERRVVI
jgi:PHP family Zn ribbon phosphoesterase